MIKDDQDQLTALMDKFSKNECPCCVAKCLSDTELDLLGSECHAELASSLTEAAILDSQTLYDDFLVIHTCDETKYLGFLCDILRAIDGEQENRNEGLKPGLGIVPKTIN